MADQEALRMDLIKRCGERRHEEGITYLVNKIQERLVLVGRRGNGVLCVRMYQEILVRNQY